MIQPLPPGWIEYRAQGGKPYWFNTFTRQSTWQRPFAPAAAPPPPTSIVQLNTDTINNTEQPKKLKKSRQKIPGTNWLLVTTDDGIDFYYNKDTKTSVWEMPPELEEPIKKMKEEIMEKNTEKRKQTMEEDTISDSKKQKIEQTEASQLSESNDQHNSTEMTEEDIMWQMENMDPEELEALGITNEDDQEGMEVQEVLQEEYNQPFLDNQPTVYDNQLLSNNVDVNKNDESQQSNEEKIEQFTLMLTEKDISPFSTWEKELPKLISDPRYQLVQPHSKRKTLFDNYCRILALEKKSKKEMKKSPEEDFKELLNDMVTTKMYWDDFKRKAKNEPRFKVINESRIREKLFKEHIKQLSRPTSNTTKPSTKTSARRTPEERYRDLLIEKKVHVGMRWRDAKRILEHDDRYHDIESKTLREEFFRDYLDELDKK
ncbi:unnamed protein product [Cunninghamella blakesleeana]